MKSWRLLPSATKIYLVILGYLAVILGFLVLARSARLPVSIDDIRGWVSGATPTASADATANAPAQPTATYPPGAAWLRANAQTPILSQPNTDSQVLALLEAGDTALVIGASPDRQFWAIRVPYFEAEQAWVPAGQVLVQNGNLVDVITVEASGAPLPTEQWPIAEMTTNVNVRKLPSLDGQRLDVLEPGQVVPVISKSEDGFWYSIEMPDGRTGWVSVDYVRVRNPENIPVATVEPATMGTVVPSPEPGKPYLIATWAVNIRSGPGREYPVIGQLEQGQSAQVEGISEDGIWLAIAFLGSEDQRGWVAANYVQALNTEGLPVIP